MREESTKKQRIEERKQQGLKVAKLLAQLSDHPVKKMSVFGGPGDPDWIRRRKEFTWGLANHVLELLSGGDPEALFSEVSLDPHMRNLGVASDSIIITKNGGK